jgi:predicted transcriptional regulator
MPTLLEIATALVTAQIEAGMEFPEGVNETLRQTFATLETLKAQEEGVHAIPQPVVVDQPTDWRKSITKSSITCLECGKVAKQLTPRHLRIHDLDSRSYRLKYGIPSTQALAARDTTMRRQQVVLKIKPWEKSPAYRAGQERRIAAEEAVAEEIASSAPKTVTRPRGRPKTTPKKQTVPKSKRGG